MKIGVDVTWLPGDGRGMGRYVRSILHELLADNTLELCFISRDPVRTVLTEALGQPYPVKNWRDRTLKELHVCWYPWNRVDVPAPTRRVVTIHDVGAVDWPVVGHPFAWLDNLKARRMLHDAVKRADRVMTVSNFTQQRIDTLFKPAVVDVVSEGALLGRDTVPVRIDQPFVLFVGAVEPRKNVGALLEAWGQIVSAGRHGGRVLALRAGPPLPSPSQVVWLPPQDEPQLSWLYRHCDLFVTPSLYEGFGLPLLEAMAAGAPVASSHATSLPEVGGSVPEYFNPRDPVDMARAMCRVLEDPERTQAMRTAGPARAAEFTWRRAALQVIASLQAATCV